METTTTASRPASGFFGNLAGAFLLRDAEAWARRLPDSERQVLTSQVARARQKLESARLLWAHEQYVEGLRLSEEAVVEVLRAAEQARAVLAHRPHEVGPMSSGAPVWADVLGALGATPDEIQDATVAMGGPLGQRPGWNGDLRPEHRRYFRGAIRVAEGALERLEPLVTAPARIVTSRWIRVVGVIAVVTAFAVTFFWIRNAVSVRASATFNEAMYDASKVNDGNPKTEWLLPTNTAGWIEIAFRPRKVNAVKLLNARNAPFHDRAAQDVRVELYRDKKVVHTIKHKFAKLEENPAWVTLPTGQGGVRADAIRVVIDSHHKTGAGLAELAFD